MGGEQSPHVACRKEKGSGATGFHGSQTAPGDLWEQDASLGTPAGVLGLLHLQSPQTPEPSDSDPQTQLVVGGRGADVPPYLTPLTLRYVMSPSPHNQLSREAR